MMTINDLLGARIAGTEQTVRVKRSVKSFLDIPSKISLSYIDVDLDHSQNVVISQIHDEIEKESKINLPIVMTQSQAKDLADKTLYLERLGRIAYSFSLPRTHLQFDAGDIIAIEIDGELLNLLITDIAYDPRGILTFTAVENDIDIFDISSNFPTSTPRPVIDRTVPTSIYSLFNLPYITDSDNGNILTALALSQQNWNGASLFRSYDAGETYTELPANTLTGTFWGQAVEILGDANPNLIDRKNHIKIVPNGANTTVLNSITELQMLNGANTMLVGNEIIRFTGAQLELDGGYTISVLQRGVRGTEQYISNHVANEDCYLLNSRTMINTDLNRQTYFKALAFNSYETILSVSPSIITPHGEALRPYAPTHVKGSRNGSGDLTISWQRRTRLFGDWRGAGDVPLAETTENYQVDIMNGSTVVRTINTTTKDTFYTAAQQIADFGSVQSSIAVRIYQISAQVGRGKTNEVNI